jgi:hypothetical protein
MGVFNHRPTEFDCAAARWASAQWPGSAIARDAMIRPPLTSSAQPTCTTLACALILRQAQSNLIRECRRASAASVLSLLSGGHCVWEA